MRKGFIEYCPNCHYHTDFSEMSILNAIRQVDEDWKENSTSEAVWAMISQNKKISCHCMEYCPICGEKLEDYYGTGEPVVNGVYQNRKVSAKFMEVINETV